jgi:hypothetical protein
VLVELTVTLADTPVAMTDADGFSDHEYDDRPDGAAVRVHDEPAHTVALPAVAATVGLVATVTVNGIVTDAQPLAALLTVRLKSYTPAGADVGIEIAIGEEDKVALLIVEKPDMALIPALSVYLFGL